MKLLLTSGGIRNPSIERALVELLGKPIAESDALCIPTGLYAHPGAGPQQAWRSLSGAENRSPFVSLPWRSMGVLELTALPSLGRERWLPWVEAADVLLADGGDATYLAHHMRESGLAELLPTLDLVWVGLSAGSMVMTPRIGESFVRWDPPDGDRTLGLVDFSIFPHLDVFPSNTMEAAERWAEEIAGPAYVVDDDTAIQVVDGVVEVVSEGVWKQLA